MPEIEIYHFYSPEEAKPVERLIKKDKPKFHEILSRIATLFAVLGVVLLVVDFAPSAYYSIRYGASEKISKLLVKTATDSENTKVQEVNKNLSYQPRFDSLLSKYNRLKIPSARIDTTILEAPLDSYETALRKGVWRVTDFGTPDNRVRPTILAAHRYGYLAWSVPYRLKNSFYSLPKLKVGDVVEIDWNQRKYLYEIYAEDKGEDITDYSADLILYTCEALDSSVRIFKYGKLLLI